MIFTKYTQIVPLDLRIYVERMFRKEFMLTVIIPSIKKVRVDSIIRLRHKYTRVDASHQLDDYYYWASGFSAASHTQIDDRLSNIRVTKNSDIPIFMDSELKKLTVQENEMFYNYLIFVKYNEDVNQCPLTTRTRSWARNVDLEKLVVGLYDCDLRKNLTFA